MRPPRASDQYGKEKKCHAVSAEMSKMEKIRGQAGGSLSSILLVVYLSMLLLANELESLDLLKVDDGNSKMRSRSNKRSERPFTRQLAPPFGSFA